MADTKRVSLQPLLVLLIIGLGMLLRFSQYLSNRSLWLDEAFLADNLFTLSYAGLLHQPLLHLQTAPPFFLWLVKALISIFGSSEYSLRLLPLLAGCASLPLYYLLLKRVIPGAGSVMALALFSFSSNLIYYASELKPYSWEVLVGILLALFLLDMPGGNPKPKKLIAYSAAGAVSLWASYSSGIILIAAMLASLAAGWKKKNLKNVLPLIPVWLSWLACFWVLYKICLAGWSKNPQLMGFYHGFWGDRFIAQSASPWSAATSLVWAFIQGFRDPGALHVPVAAAALYAAGVLRILKKNKSPVLLVLLPVVVTLLFACFKWIPYGNRPVLFLVPFLYVPIAAGLGFLWESAAAGLKAAAAVFSGVLFVPLLWVAGGLLFHPIQIEEVKPLLAHISSHRKAEDAVYVYHWTQHAYRYYASRYGFNGGTIIGESMAGDSGLRQLVQLKAYPRVWVLVSYGYRWVAFDEVRKLLQELDSLGQRSAEMHRAGASLYLYQFSR